MFFSFCDARIYACRPLGLYFFTIKDPKNKNQSNKVFGLVLWVCPAVSLFVSGVSYAASFGKEVPVDLISLLIIGLMFVIIGNYLPKCRQNHTIGVRVKWTLENEENWNATHRISGRIWVIGGLLMMACVFLPRAAVPWVFLLFLVTLAVIPVVYSYLYYRRQLKNGTASVTPILKSSVSKAIVIGCAVFVAAILVFIGIIMFSGDIGIKYGDESFTVDASFWNGITVEYEAIDSIEYRDNIDTGIRTYGFGSPKLLAGSFCNEEFGDYTRYSYAGCSACVVLNVGDKILVISGADAESTRNIYNELTAKIKQS